MKELTTQTGIIVKCSKTAIEFFQNAQSVDSFSVLEIPGAVSYTHLTLPTKA